LEEGYENEGGVMKTVTYQSGLRVWYFRWCFLHTLLSICYFKRHRITSNVKMVHHEK